MIRGSTSNFPNESQNLHIHGLMQNNVDVSSSFQRRSIDAISSSLLYNLSVLTDKFHQVQSQAQLFLYPDQSQFPDSKAIALASLESLIQDIIITSSSMMMTCQQMALGPTDREEESPNLIVDQPPNSSKDERGHEFYSNGVLDWYSESYNTGNTDTNEDTRAKIHESNEGFKIDDDSTKDDNDIIEMDVEILLAKYTHFCQVCGKGFKRDANLRMHMRAHGEEYKSNAALINPMKKIATNSTDELNKSRKKYSCPQEGCRWNKKHAKFQPLKSMICVKNHYKRNHCPKMYICKQCNAKRFSVLSDLRTHEKHCGDLRWMCSCGTTFSRKDKLLGHIALFVGHVPVRGIEDK